MELEYSVYAVACVLGLMAGYGFIGMLFIVRALQRIAQSLENLSLNLLISEDDDVP